MNVHKHHKTENIYYTEFELRRKQMQEALDWFTKGKFERDDISAKYGLYLAHHWLMKRKSIALRSERYRIKNRDKYRKWDKKYRDKNKERRLILRRIREKTIRYLKNKGSYVVPEKISISQIRFPNV